MTVFAPFLPPAALALVRLFGDTALADEARPRGGTLDYGGA
jgi:hypothetical protein